MIEQIEREMQRTGLNEIDYEEYIFKLEDSNREHKNNLLNSDQAFFEWLESKPDRNSHVHEIFENIFNSLLVRK
jgi:N12 class adenine-specific DNA methylase